MTSVAQLLVDANNAASDRVARLEQIDTQIKWHGDIIAELRCDRAALNDEPPAYYDRFGDNLQTIASGIAGKRRQHESEDDGA